MKNKQVVEIDSIGEISGKYAEFKLTDGSKHYGKYSYFSYIAYNLIGGIKFPVKVRLDSLGLKYFHVEAIFHKGLWVKLKARGF